MRVVAYAVMLLAAIGLLASFFLYVANFVVPGLGPLASKFLFPGIFVVWLPTVLLMNRLTRDFKQRDVWKAALRGCPPWMKTGLWVVVGFAMLAAFVVPLLRGKDPGQGGFLIFPACFYSISFCTMYSLLHVEEFDTAHRCLNGHRVSPLAKFCEECGAPTAPEGLQPPRTM